MRYGFISSKNQDTIEEQIEALKDYDLDEIIIDEFDDELDCLFEKLKAGDSLYIEEFPISAVRFIAIYSFARNHDITLYMQGDLVGEIPQLDLFDAYVKLDIAKRIGYTK